MVAGSSTHVSDTEALGNDQPGETGSGKKLRTRKQTTKSEETRRQRLRESGGGADRFGKPVRDGRKTSPGSSQAATCGRLRPAVGCGLESAPPPRGRRSLGPAPLLPPPSPLAVQSGAFLLFLAPSSGPAAAWNLPLPLLAPDTTHLNAGPSSVSNCHTAPWLGPSPFHSAHLRLQSLFPYAVPLVAGLLIGITA